MHKNSYVLNNLHLYTKILGQLKQQTEIFFISNSLCSRAEFPWIWKTVRKAKLFDFAVLFLLDQIPITRHQSSDQ